MLEILIWEVIGLVLSMSIAAMVISGSYSIKSFYDVGKVYEFRESIYRSYIVQENGYQEVSGTIVLDKGEFKHTVNIEGKARDWSYFCIDISEMNSDSLECSMIINYYENEQLLGQMEKDFILKKGLNIVEIPGMKFQVAEIVYTGEENTSFEIRDMQFRDNKPVFTYSKFIGITILIFLIYSLIIVTFRIVWVKQNLKINFYVWIDILQEIFIKFAEQFVKIKKCFPFLNNHESIIRIGLFLGMFLFNIWIDMYGNYTGEFKYYVLIYLFLIILIAIVSIGDKLQKVCWNNPLVWSWIFVWCIACISDFIIQKNYRFSGYAIVLGIGFFIFIWNNMKEPDEILKDFKKAIYIFLIIITVFCLVCRPEVEGIRYSGFGRNPSVFGLYLSVCWAVVLSEIEEGVRAKNRVVCLMPYLLGLCVIFVFALKSQSACPLLSMAFVVFIWIVRNSHYVKLNHSKKYLLCTMVLTILLLIPTYIGIDWGINHIPQKLDTAITLKGEIPVAKTEYGLVAQAADIEKTIKNSRLGQKFSSGSFSTIISWRDYYYRTYLREMNLLGHKDLPVMWGHRRLPHNAILGIAYQYGVLAVIPYILMLLYVIVRTWRYSFSEKKYAVMPFYVCFSVIIMSMADNIERPFSWLPWFALYLLMGIVFKENE